MAKKMSMRDRVRQKAQQKRDSSSFSSYLRFPEGADKSLFKPKKEVHYLDVIPYIISDEHHPDVQSDLAAGFKKDDPDRLQPGSQWHSRRFFVHRNVGSENKAYLCPLQNQGKPCPICEYSKARKEEGADYEELKQFRPKERWLLNVIDIKSEDKKIMVWDVSDFPFGQKLVKELTQEDEDYGNFAELEDGLTMKLRFENKKFGKNTYMEVDKLDFIERKKGYKESIIDKAFDLDQLLVYSSYATIESAFLMGEAQEEPEDDEKEERRPSKPKNRREPEPEDDDDDGDTAEQAEEEKEERKPKVKPKNRKEPEPEPEDDDSDADSDDDSDTDEAPEPPKRSSRRDSPKKEEKKKPKKKGDEDEDEEKQACPAGAKFGKDFDKYEDCDECKYARACMKAAKEYD